MSIIQSIPGVSSITGIVTAVTGPLQKVSGSLSLSGSAGGSAGITGGLNLSFPDCTGQITTLAGSFSGIIGQAPDPAKLMGGLGEIIGGIKTVSSFSLKNDLETIAKELAEAISDPKDLAGLIAGLVKPFSKVKDVAGNAQFQAIMKALGAIAGKTIPQADLSAKIGDLSKILTDYAEGKVGNSLTCFTSLLSLESFGGRLKTWSGSLGTILPAATLETGVGGVMSSFSPGGQSLATIITQNDWSSAPQAALAQERVAAAIAEVTKFLSEATKDLVVMEATALAFKPDLYASKMDKIITPLDAVDVTKVKELLYSLSRVVRSIKEGIDDKPAKGVPAADFKPKIRAALVKVADTIDACSISAITNGLTEKITGGMAGLDKIGEIQNEIALEIRAFFASIREAVERIDLSPVTSALDAAFDAADKGLAEVKKLLDALVKAIRDALQAAKSALETVRTALLDPSSGALAQITGILSGITQALNDLNIGAAIDAVKAKVNEIANAVGKAEFSPVVDPVVEQMENLREILKKIDPSIIPDSIKPMLAEGASAIKSFDFAGTITTPLIAGIEEIKKSVVENGLGTLSAAFTTALDKVRDLDPAVTVCAVIKTEAYDPLVAALSSLDPNAIFAPIVAAHRAADAALKKVDPAVLMEPLVAGYNELREKFDTLDPAALVKPLEDLLAEATAAVNGALKVAELKQRIADVAAPARQKIEDLKTDTWMAEIETCYAEIREQVESLDAAAIAKPFAGMLDSMMGRFGSPMAGSGLRGFFEKLKTLNSGPSIDAFFGPVVEKLTWLKNDLAAMAMSEKAVVIGNSCRSITAALAPNFGPAESAVAPVRTLWSQVDYNGLLSLCVAKQQAALAAVNQTLDAVSSFKQQAEQRFAKVDAIRVMFADMIQEFSGLPKIVTKLAGSMFPGAAIDGILGLLKTLLVQMDPAEYKTEIEAIVTRGKARLIEIVSPDGAAAIVENVLNAIVAKMTIIDVSALKQELQSIHQAVADKLDELSPAAVADELSERYQVVVDLLSSFDAATFGGEINDLLNNQIKPIVTAIDPDTVLLPPLKAAFDEAVGLLSGLDITNLAKPLLDAVSASEEALTENLLKADTAFKQMAAAIPV